MLSTRIALYWHNGRSLGHTAESAKLANVLSQELSDVSIAGITGASKGLDMFGSAIDIVKLPSFANFDTPTKTIMAPVLSITPRELFWVRENLITTFVQGFRPHLLIVNHLPQGLHDELVPVIIQSPATKKVLTLRGILFDAEKTNAEYFNPSMISWIDEHFSLIHVHIDPAVFRLEDHYSIPDSLIAKLVYTGYITDSVLLSKEEARQALDLSPQSTVLVASMGGGQGAHDIWNYILEMIETLRDKFDLAYLVTGPYLESAAYQELQERVAKLKQVQLIRYTSTLPMWMKACDVFVGAGGANMLGEVLSTRTNAIIIPRQFREAEQEMHTSRLENLGLVRKITRTQLEKRNLADIVLEALISPCDINDQVALNGNKRSVQSFKQLLGIDKSSLSENAFF